jgi:DnaJ-class molecular chaperone
MALDPYSTLGLAGTASKEDAKAAYRRLAMEHHPDRGGSEATFKSVKAAWEAIEAGWTPPVPEQIYKSHSFGDQTAKKKSSSFTAGTPKAGKPAPGYEAKNVPPPLPRTLRDAVTLEISQDQAFRGCTVPFLHNGKMLYHTVRPGAVPSCGKELFLEADRIGAKGWDKTISIEVTLKIINSKEAPADNRLGNMHISTEISVLGLMVGGQVSVKDHLNEIVSISIPAGYNPTESITIPGRGYGVGPVRGDLILKINPVFKSPADFTAKDMKLVQRLNEMIRQ